MELTCSAAGRPSSAISGSALFMLVLGVGVSALSPQGEGNATPPRSAQPESARGTSPGCLRIPGWRRGKRQVIVQSKSVTTPALAALAEAELAANNPWSIPNRRNEGWKNEPAEARVLVVWAGSRELPLWLLARAARAACLCSTGSCRAPVHAGLGTLFS